MSVPISPSGSFNLARSCLGPDAVRAPNKTALTIVHDSMAPADRAERWTYGSLDESVRQIAGGLKSLGLEPGARLMIRMENTSAVPLLFFGAIAAGLIAVPTSPQLTRHEARLILQDSGSTLLATSPGLELSELPGGVKQLAPDDLGELLASPATDYADTQAEDPAFIVYTSGTSGRPKGVLHAQRSVLGRRPMHAGWLGLTNNDRILHAGAFNWTYTLGVGLMDPWSTGASTIVYNGPKGPVVWPRLIDRFGATIFAAVPSLYRPILKYADIETYDLSSLRHGVCAGEALAPALAREWTKRTAKPLFEALGMSECSTYISSSPSVPRKSGSPGKPQTGRQVVILPLEGDTDPLPPGETGYLAVHRSDPGLMLGYWKRPDEDTATRRGDWFLGGDLASMDGEGYVFFHGRGDGVMNALGYRVSPEEVEAALLDHPAIAEVGVAEVAIRSDLSLIVAFVVPTDPDHPPFKDAIQDHAATRLAAYKCPRSVVFCDALPRTANGKIKRQALPTLWQG